MEVLGYGASDSIGDCEGVVVAWSESLELAGVILAIGDGAILQLEGVVGEVGIGDITADHGLDLNDTIGSTIAGDVGNACL